MLLDWGRRRLVGPAKPDGRPGRGRDVRRRLVAAGQEIEEPTATRLEEEVDSRVAPCWTCLLLPYSEDVERPSFLSSFRATEFEGPKEGPSC